TALGGVDERARNLKTLDQIRKGSLDYYATIRSLYRQRRQDEINNGASPPAGVGLEGGATSAVPAPPVAAFLATKDPIGTGPSAPDRWRTFGPSSSPFCWSSPRPARCPGRRPPTRIRRLPRSSRRWARRRSRSSPDRTSRSTTARHVSASCSTRISTW